mmetsp:Transcript_47044/g.150214  ORF Transcript_47044/g.150214 Transcript_47044/m.150214 type:complete len:218 (-) Transcript_47044:467-1120(-)
MVHTCKSPCLGLAPVAGAHNLPLEANLQIACVFHDPLKLLGHQHQLLEKIIWRRLLLELDGLDQGLRELLPHGMRSIHFVVRVTHREQVRDDLRVQLPLNLKESLELPLVHLPGELGLVPGTCRDDAHLPQGRQELRNPSRSAVLHPPSRGVGNDECLPEPASRLQKPLCDLGNLLEALLHNARQGPGLVHVEEGCAQQRIVPIKDYHGLAFGRPLR